MIVIKVGSSLLVEDKLGAIKKDWFASFIDDVIDLRKKGKTVIVVSSGAINLGRKILNMKENKGHARCNAFGIKYLSKKNDYDHLVIMDGDGEDQPEELVSLVNTAIENKDKFNSNACILEFVNTSVII